MTTLKPIKPKCCKCGAGPSKIKVRYESKYVARSDAHGYGYLDEMLWYTCECGWSWITKCLDAKEKA